MPQDERTRMLDALTKINEQWIKTIDDYHFPVVTLSDGLGSVTRHRVPGRWVLQQDQMVAAGPGSPG
jgi:predicted dienelactone hydrolase